MNLGDFELAVAEALEKDGSGRVNIEIGDWSLGVKSITVGDDGGLTIMLDETGILIDIEEWT
jgi:hypothetical protein